MGRAFLLATVFGLWGLSAPALAADNVVEEAVAAGPSWSGFYIGAHTGVAMGNLGYDEYDFLAPSVLESSTHFADTSLLGGVHIGYDHQFSERWVGGIEADFTWLGQTYSVNYGQPPLFWAKWQAGVSARAGYLLSPDTLFYGRLGAAFIHGKAPEGPFDYVTDTITAAKIGVGAETFISSNLTARIEANYLLATQQLRTADEVEFDPSQLMITAGLTYRFGADGGSAYAVPRPAVSWNGFYGGLSGVFSHASMDRVLNLGLGDPQETVSPFGSRSAGAGAFAGYDFQISDSSVLGVEVAATWLGLNFHDERLNSLLAGSTSRFATVHASFVASARAGWLASPSTLLYAKAGFGGLLTEANDEFWPLGEGGSKLLPAYQVGGGIESALTDRLTLRVEGLYTAATSSFVLTNAQNDQISLKPSVLTGTVGLAWRF